MRRDARAALPIAKNRPKIGLSAGRSSTASFGGLRGGGCSQSKLVSMAHFPANSEIYREFPRIWALLSTRRARIPRRCRYIWRNFPNQSIRENISKKQGIGPGIPGIGGCNSERVKFADSVVTGGLNHDGHHQVQQAALFHEFSLERHVPINDLLQSIDRLVELGELRRGAICILQHDRGAPRLLPN
jgi:hypothetical protein